MQVPVRDARGNLPASLGGATANRMSLVRDFPDLPPVWMLGHGALAAVLHRWLPLVGFEGTVASRLGIALGLGGVALAGWSAMWFWWKRTPIEPREEPRALIVEGPYRLNRNPIYTAMAACLLGFSMWLGSLTALLAVLPFPFVIDRRFIRGEEEALKSAFGAQADDYFEATRRW